MYGRLLSFTLIAFLVSGCGGGDSKKRSSEVDSASRTHSAKAYNLWEYMTPSKSKTNRYTTYVNKQKDSTYKTTYSVTSNRVVESEDYAKDEQTIYEKRNNSIVVRFTKNGKPNGMYTLHLWADVGDIITGRNSNCELKAHYDQKEIAGKIFDDVIEIRCGDIPGYYQKGVGEIAQIESKEEKRVRVLSN